MSAPPLLDRSVRRIAVLRALPGLGDLLCLVPALRAVRAAAPSAEIDLLGLASAQWFATRFADLVDNLVVVAHNALPETRSDADAEKAFVAWSQQQRFDLALQCHGDGAQSNRVVGELGAGRTVGAVLDTGGDVAGGPDGEFVVVHAEQHEILRLLAVVEAAGAPAGDPELTWRRLPSDPVAGRAGPYVCIHPGASVADRRWPSSAFATVADHLADGGLDVVLTGTAAERPLCDAVAAAMRNPAENLAGRTELGALAELLRTSSLTVANDTGVAHLAVALRCPTVVVHTRSSPRRWGPLDPAFATSVDARGQPPAAALAAVVAAARSLSTLRAVGRPRRLGGVWLGGAAGT